jgi:ubiquinone/menaquinone biosynthesis C-methylase UbiE
MEENIKNYSKIKNNLGYIIKHEYLDASEIQPIKQLIQDSYTRMGQGYYKNIFMNLGLWNKKILREYLRFPTATNVQIYSQLLLYYLIRPLVKTLFFNKRLLDVGCGNGRGLQKSSELLKTQYALGVDLTNILVINSNNNFYEENKINFLQSDAEHLALESESFDVVTNLESSHLYPRIEYFFSEVERVLSPGGFFCYADFYVENKRQTEKLETFISNNKNLKIIKKNNITRMIQSSIYQRLIVNEDMFYQNAHVILGHDEDKLLANLPALASSMGLEFLPWWKIWFKNKALHELAKRARKDTYWNKKYYFYYLIQKV